MYKEISYEELGETLTKVYIHTQDSFNTILEVFSRLKNIECYKYFALSCEEKLNDYAKSLN